MVRTAAQVIADSLDRLPDSTGRCKVSIITFDSEIHFFAFNTVEQAYEMLVIGEVDDAFVPCPDNVLVDVATQRDLLKKLLNELPSYFEQTQRTSPCFAAAINAAVKTIAPHGGKVISFLSTLPNSSFTGGLKNRDDPSILGTPKESSLMKPENNFYKMFASTDAVRLHVCLDLFLFPAQYIDVATLGTTPF